MKNKLFIIIGALLVVGFGVAGIFYLLSLHKVSFEMQNNITEVTVYRKDKQKIKDVSADENLSLQDGAYYAVPKGDNFSKDPIRFVVEGEDKTVRIDPAYTKEYLAKLLKDEERSIMTAIGAKYPSATVDYTLTHGTLYEQGEWFGGLLEPKVSDRRDIRDPYRVVLHKKNGSWEVIRRPEYILTSSKYGDVPVDILKAINSIVE